MGTVQTNIRLDKDLRQWYDEKAAADDRDAAYFMKKALVQFRQKFEGLPQVDQAPSKEVATPKKEAAKPAKPKFNDEHMRFAVWAYECILNTMSGVKKPNFESWAKDVRLMLEADNRNIDDMANVWQWVRNDSFWQSNILSMKKFRDQFDTVKAQSMRPVGKTNRDKMIEERNRQLRGGNQGRVFENECR